MLMLRMVNCADFLLLSRVGRHFLPRALESTAECFLISFRLFFQETLSPEILPLSQLLFPNSSSCNLPCRNSIPLSHLAVSYPPIRSPISQEEVPKVSFPVRILTFFSFLPRHTHGDRICSSSSATCCSAPCSH